MKLNIIFENQDFLVLKKPPGLLVHPTSKQEKETLVSLLLKKYPDIKNVGEDEERPGIVHRLDKDVSGLMVVVRNQKSFLNLKNQFKNRKLKKEYLALVYGQIKPKQGIISFAIGRSSKKGGKMKVQKGIGGKEAFSKYQLIKYYQDFSLIKVRTKTGRTHQIRAHLKVIGFPLVGDPIHKPKKKRIIELGLKRPFLHSHLLGFYDSKGKWREYKSPLPEDLEKVLKSLTPLQKVG